jgi:hypothetical protein
MRVTLQHLDTCYPYFFPESSEEVIAVGYFPCEDPTFIADSIKDELEYVFQEVESLELPDKDINDMATWLFSIWNNLYIEEEEVTEDYIPEIYSYLAVVPYEEEEED